MTKGPENRKLTDGRADVRRLVVLGAAVAALILFGALALLGASSRALDDLQAREDRVRVQTAVERAMDTLVGNITTATVWDQAYHELKPGGRSEWLDAEIGSYFANNRGHDWTIAIDRHGAPFYAWVGKHRADPAAQRQLLADVAPIVRRVRRQEAARGEHPPAVLPTDPSLAESAAGLVLSQGVHYLVGVSTVTPEDAHTPRAPGPGVIVISGQRADRMLLADLRELRLRDPMVVAAKATGPAVVRLKAITGEPLGSIVWREDRPGLRALGDAAPVLALGALIASGVLTALGLQILRIARRLHLHEAAHAAAMRDLEDARDRAEAANIAKSRFLANMSHEIRTPLNGVLGMAQILGRSELKPHDRDRVQVIRASGEMLLGLLNDLLDLSKIEAGRMEIDLHDFDLETAVDAATRSFSAMANQKDVGFVIEIDPDARGVWRGDGSRFRQVLANMVSNAVKFTQAGEVRVSIGRIDDGVTCTVSDTGLGIAPDRLDQLFHRFAQVDPSDTRKHGGTGLGLAISREFVHLMGGKLTVSSDEGKGSSFCFELPLVWIAPRRRAEPTVDAEPELPPLRLLAAEDNKTNQLLLTALLEPLGVELRLEQDGRAALEAFKSDRFDLVLMDVQMPVMNGVDATRAIRAFEAEQGRETTPILALSANVMRHQTEEYLAAGMNGFIAKPIEMAALVAAIENALTPVAERAVA